MRVIEGMNPYTKGLGLEQSLALQRAARQRRVPSTRSSAGVMQQPEFGVPPMEFAGNPNASDFGLGAFGKAAAERMWNANTEQVAKNMRMWRR